MLTVNLLDAAFAHLTGSSVHGKVAKHIRYERGHLSWDGITLITDSILTDSNILDVLHSRVKIGWLLESRDYCPQRYRAAIDIAPRLDALLTHDQRLLDALPGKARFVPFGGCWIRERNFGLGWHKCESRVSHIYSNKQFMEGHLLRHQIAATVPGLDLYGTGSPKPVTLKESALANYKFSIAVENNQTRNYFTEKLLDCFAVGTVPIYWGAPNIGDFFDMRGIITFDKAADLPEILKSLDYASHREGIEENFRRFRQYEITDDWIALNVLKDYA